MLALSLNGGQVIILSTYVGNARERSRARGDCDGRDWRHGDLAGQGGRDGDDISVAYELLSSDISKETK